jgi:hypothetical protein
MRIELLYFDGCPNYGEFLSALRALLRKEGIEDEIVMRRVETVEDAERERFLGSPTPRIDGEDVDPGAAGRREFGLDCRLYRTAEGVSRTPPEPWIRAALQRAPQAVPSDRDRPRRS